MEMTVIDTIKNAILDIRQLSMNDVLVDATNRNIFSIETPIKEFCFSLPLDNCLISILKKSNQFQKETGVNSLCLTSGIAEWNIKSTAVKTPLVVVPLVFTISKIKNTVDFELILEDAFINPFLVSYLWDNFELKIPDFEFNLSTSLVVNDWLKSTEIPFIFQNKQLIGNFHHHRYHIVKDLEGLVEVESLSENVCQILGNEEHSASFAAALVKDCLFPADNDQLNVFDVVSTSNCVIQGPPGTGKSQVLSNLIGKILISSSKALVVSEKRGALEVLQNKLSQFQLDDFTFITTSETNSTDFIQSLKKVWDRIEMNAVENKTVNLRLSEHYLQQLQNQLDLLSKKELIGGISFDEFKSHTAAVNFSNTRFLSEAPSMLEWLKDRETISTIYSSNLDKVIQFVPFEVLKSDIFQTFDIKMVGWKKILLQLSVHFKIETLEDLVFSMKQAAICQVIENESFKSYHNLLQPASKERKKFSALKKRFSLIQKESEALMDERNNWKIEPSENETIQLLEALNTTSYFKKRKAKNRISQLVKSSFVEPISALKNWLIVLENQKKELQIKFEFSEIGVKNPATECLIIESYLLQIDQKGWEIYSSIAAASRSKLCEYHSLLNQFHSVLKTYFNLRATALITTVFSSIETHFESLIRFHHSIARLQHISYRLVGVVDTFTEYEQIVFKSNWVRFEAVFPEMAKFEPSTISLKVDEICKEQKLESVLFARQIESKIHTNFQAYHQLLRTPSQKLNAQQKLFKQQLKKGKSLLVKEFSKSKCHPSIRELLQSAALHWIDLLKPIWLSNPSQIARCLPLEKHFFEYTIFDEASQIPLPHALGCLHRGKRIIVAGDEQQMSPTSYFKVGNSECVDLLHQAGFYWKNTYLKHHYRSVHPGLIEFSNTHFYQNSLIAYPSGTSFENPIRIHHCEQGIFENRTNEEEAIRVVQLLTKSLDSNDSIGIVAFSESQLQCILEQLPTSIQSIISDKMEKGDLFFKTLEHVQGEECDRLIISLGYAKNRGGEFQMRFGPLNQKSGSKRLNVLLTRAKKSIDFVTSVASKDFKMSDNESINLLRLFLHQVEEKVAVPEIRFPFNLKAEITPKTTYSEVYFPSIYTTITDVNELVTFQRVLKNRNWVVK